MMITLAAGPAPKPPESWVVPECLQSRAPHDYELRDHLDRPVRPTLAGYKLRRGKRYLLRVTTQNKTVNDWRLRLLAPRSIVEEIGDNIADGDKRDLYFETKIPPVGEPWARLSAQIDNLPFLIEYGDGREPFHFNMPIILLPSRWRWLASLVFGAIIGYLTQASYSGFFIPRPDYVALALALWILIVFLFSLRDQWKLYHQALALRPKSEVST